MLGQEGYVDIHVMHRQRMSITAISRELGVSRNTVRGYLRSAAVPKPQARAAKPSKLDAYRDYLKSRVEAARPDWIPAAVLFDEIRALGYSGGYEPSAAISPRSSPSAKKSR
jgi:transposase